MSSSHSSPAPVTSRQTLSLDFGWRFHPGDVDASVANTHIAAYMANKAGWARGAAKPTYDDSDWRTVDLPHDWSVEGPLDPSNHLSNGYLPRGVGWYRRYFTLDESDRGRHLALRFDGVSSHCTVFVNGHVIHRNFCGYTPFTVDISDVANFGEQLNVIAVRVDATPVEGWWYEGAGIYRHVSLMKTDRLHVAPDGVFVRAERRGEDSDEWETIVETRIENPADERLEFEIVSEILDVEDRVIVRGSARSAAEARGGAVVQQLLAVTSPRLWSVDEPYLYRLYTSIRRGDVIVDERVTTFGYRTVRFDADRGFFLNDEPLKLLGTCNHQDHAGVGVAVPDSIDAFRIRRLKEMGANAYRCAHNPPSASLLDACDRLGMLVMDENRTFGSSPEHLSQLGAMVRRDRNHPCVIMWSLCNEEAIQGTPTAARIARTMTAEVRRLDPSRPVTAAVSGGLLNDDCLADSVEIVGINYQLAVYDPFHAKHPTTPMYAAETHCSYATRGEYETDAERRVFSSYDEGTAPWGATARQTWRAVSERPFVAGLFAWTGFDYRGEPTPHEWPSVSTHWGILDTCGFAKDAYHLHRAWFTPVEREPFVHLLPHWNWPGREGQEIRVMAYTNAEAAELFLNGESLGRRAVDRIEMAEWRVAFRPGELKAVGFVGDRVVATMIVQTTGPAVALGLEVHPSADVDPLPADGQFAVPATVFAIDAQNRRVPTAMDRVTFAIRGAGRIIGTGSGDPNSHEPDKALARQLFNGLAQVIVQTTTAAGEMTIEAHADGLRPAQLRLTSTPAERHVVPSVRARHFVTDWRMSPITPDRPDVNDTAAAQDMNSWERIDPTTGPQKSWAQRAGHAIYRAMFAPPRSVQARGGRIVMHQVVGKAEVFLNGASVGLKVDAASAPISVELAAGVNQAVLSILVTAGGASAGLGKSVEVIEASATV